MLSRPTSGLHRPIILVTNTHIACDVKQSYHGIVLAYITCALTSRESPLCMTFDLLLRTSMRVISYNQTESRVAIESGGLIFKQRFSTNSLATSGPI